MRRGADRRDGVFVTAQGGLRSLATGKARLTLGQQPRSGLGAIPARSDVRPGVSLRAMSLFTRKTEMVAPEQALPGRDEPMPGLGPHLVLGTPIVPPFPDGSEQLVVGMGCFWGADSPF